MKHKKTKKYTVNFKQKDEEGNSNIVFKNLLEARTLARQLFRQGNFQSLLNAKKIPLTI